MNFLFPGAMIRKERMRRNWSQEGLCEGICAVSYLSKIEQGKAEAGSEILRLLFERLELPWYDDELTMTAAESLISRCYDALFSCDDKKLEMLRAEFSEKEAFISNSPYALDGTLLHEFLFRTYEPAGKDMEPFLDRRQLALQRMLQGRHEEAMRLYPCPYLNLMTGIRLYEQGGSDAAALGYLRRAYDMAAEEGYVRVMLLARFYMGNCYCNRIDIENMNAHYLIVERLARALEDRELLRDMYYNKASACLEAGRYEEAYAYFAQVQQPAIMDLHKLAICCEKLGRRGEALAALDRAEGMEAAYPDLQLSRQMCGLVRFRLEHEDYLQCPQYGEQLLHVYRECRRKMPIGYAAFHLPWVLEWHTAARQYRAAYELLRDFPIRLPIKQD